MNFRPPFAILAKDVNPQAANLECALSAFMVKGFTRSLAAMTVMLASWESPELREAGRCQCALAFVEACPSDLKRSDVLHLLVETILS